MKNLSDYSEAEIKAALEHHKSPVRTLMFLEVARTQENIALLFQMLHK